MTDPNNETDLTELSRELMSLDNLDVEELETRLELALGQLMTPDVSCKCDCPKLQSCFFYCSC